MSTLHRNALVYPLFCQIPSEIPSVTHYKELLRLQKNKFIGFFFSKGQLLYSITLQTLAYRCILYLSGTAKTQGL